MFGFTRIVVDSPLGLKEARDALATDTQRPTIPSEPSSCYFEGFVYQDGFELQRSGVFLDALRPVVTGRFAPDQEGGTVVSVTIRLSFYGLCFIGGSVALLAFLTLRVGLSPWPWLIPVAYALAYRSSARRCEQRLMDVFEME